MTDIFETTPLTPFGVELHADLSASLSPGQQAELVRLVDHHSIVVARNQQPMSLAEQRALCAPLGRIETYDLEYVALDDNVLNRDGMLHHSDFAYAHTPYKYLSLLAVDLVEGESTTTFANGALAYETLSPELRKQLAALTTTACSTDISARNIGYDLVEGVPSAIHPAVKYHHRTARPILYINEAQTGRFNELGRSESDALLEELFTILYAPAAIFTHHWRPGDLLIFDNWTVQHGRPSLESATTRHIQRVSVADVGGDDMLPGFLDPDAMELSAKQS
jgi:alpha-ketoglutarate-dependent taurine dioxygenase